MARCKACDTPFNDSDYVGNITQQEDLCSHCRFVSKNPSYFTTKEYQFESITEIPIYVENYQNTVDKS